MSFLRRGQGKAAATRIFYATDLHGSEVTWRKFINSAQFYNADVLICGGDLMGKVVVPLVRTSGSTWRASLQGQTHELATASELNSFTQRLGTLGHYWVELDEDEYEGYIGDEGRVERLFDELAKERLRKWVAFAEERLSGTHIRCLITGGNDDTDDVLAAMEELDTDRVVPCEGRVVALDDHHTVASLGYSTPTPWNTPRELPDEEIGARIEKLLEQVADPSACLFNFHVPPLDSGLDSCVKLDSTVWPPAPVVENGQPVIFGAGSRSVREAIERYHPLVSLHGHIHEARGINKYGDIASINPGSEYGEGILRGVIVNVVGNSVSAAQFTSG